MSFCLPANKYNNSYMLQSLDSRLFLFGAPTQRGLGGAHGEQSMRTLDPPPAPRLPGPGLRGGTH